MEELKNSKYILDKLENVPLINRGRWFENEYEECLNIWESELDTNRYEPTTKEVYDKFLEECYDLCYEVAEIEIGQWKKILKCLKDNDVELYNMLKNELRIEGV